MGTEAETAYLPRKEPAVPPRPVTSGIPDAVVPLSAGSIIPGLMGYSGLELIAHGSSAIVFRATQNRLNRKVAIKVLLVDDVMTTDATVRRELETLVQLSSSPHIVSIIDTGVTDAGQPYIVMEYCEGGSYAQILKERGPLPVEEVIEVGIKIGEALHAAHEAGIIHRDVKPPNILRSRFGPALTDFGIAYAADELASTNTFYKLTPHHASPETLQQDHQTGQSDLYSLASTMWNLLAGRPPFANPGQDPEAFRKRVLSQLVSRVPRDDVPDWLHDELQRAMAKRATDRHPTALAFAETLRLNMARTSMSTPWQPRSSPPGEGGVASETPTGQSTQTQRSQPPSAPPVPPSDPPAVMLPGTSAPPRPVSAPTSGATVQTPPVIIPTSAPASGSTVTVARTTHPHSSAPLPVVLPGNFAANAPTGQPPASSPPSSNSTPPRVAPPQVAPPQAAPPQAVPTPVVQPQPTEQTHQIAQSASSTTPANTVPANTTPAGASAPQPASVPRTYKSRPSHVPLPLDQPDPDTTELSPGGLQTPQSPGRPWFEPASAPSGSSTLPSPQQQNYSPQPTAPQSTAQAETAGTHGVSVPQQQEGPYSRTPIGADPLSNALARLPRRTSTADDDFDEDEDEEQFSWRRPLVTAGVIGVILGLITTVGIIVAGGAKSDKKADSEPTSSASIIAEGRPTDVSIADSRTAVTLQWKDNTSGRAGVFIYARTATAAIGKVIAVPAKGQTSYTISAIDDKPLNADIDYCFQITAVPASDQLAFSETVCTERAGAQTN
ncbi:MAG: protein kinase domain-containing protein [Mycobacteriales bacterium]